MGLVDMRDPVAVSGQEVLTVRRGGYGKWAPVRRKPGTDEVEVVRY
jgi:hypothetical protein